jgi:hypothetical protein
VGGRWLVGWLVVLLVREDGRAMYLNLVSCRPFSESGRACVLWMTQKETSQRGLELRGISTGLRWRVGGGGCGVDLVTLVVGSPSYSIDGGGPPRR